MDDRLTWTDRLNHLRFWRTIVLMEKWLSVFFLCWLFLAGLSPLKLTIVGFLFAVCYFVVSQTHFNLEDAAGMPVQHLVVRY